MDSGCVEPGDEFEELYDVARPLLPEEVLGIIDQLICHEVCFNFHSKFCHHRANRCRSLGILDTLYRKRSSPAYTLRPCLCLTLLTLIRRSL